MALSVFIVKINELYKNYLQNINSNIFIIYKKYKYIDLSFEKSLSTTLMYIIIVTILYLSQMILKLL